MTASHAIEIHFRTASGPPTEPSGVDDDTLLLEVLEEEITVAELIDRTWCGPCLDFEWCGPCF